MSQPYALFKDTRDDVVYRVAADGQSKVPTDGVALYVDQVNLEQHGYDGGITADPTVIDPWLDSVPTTG